jgi:MSHA biogenesis protein MshL
LQTLRDLDKFKHAIFAGTIGMHRLYSRHHHKFFKIRFSLKWVVLLILLSACATELPQRPDTERHIFEPASQTNAVDDIGIPDISSTTLPLGTETFEDLYEDRFSVVVQNVDARDILFAVASDAGINIDIAPDISGTISLNAVEQTVYQILDRISRQANIRWRVGTNGVVIVENDTAFLRSYHIDYVNVARDANTQISVSTSLVSVGGAEAQGGSGSNNSTAALTQLSANNIWTSLESNLRVALGDTGGTESASNAVMVNRESGVITVLATERQHEFVFGLINTVMRRALAQVLIEATVVEVTLSDEFQSGVDWATIGRDSGQLDFLQTANSLSVRDNPAIVMTLDRLASADALGATINLLSRFGDLKVLSSPKIMALNNQPAMLRVVDNRVYFTIEVEAGVPATATSAGTQPTYTSEVQTVPTGFVMSVTPQISDSDMVTLNVRPTISRVVRFVNDPNPILANAGVTSAIPEIQIREIESILKVESGQIAVLGGLMQDSLETSTEGAPFLSRLAGIGPLFSYNQESQRKTELIIFIRPIVAGSEAGDTHINSYRDYLPVREAGLTSQSRSAEDSQSSRRANPGSD